MKKIIIQGKKTEKRKTMKKHTDDISNNDLANIKKNFDLVNKLFMDIDFSGSSIVKSEINKKIRSYKSQDIKKARLDKEKFITYDYVLEQMIVCKMKCYYCKDNMKVLYTDKRDNKQWTVDRVENHLGHNLNNIVISCMSCNLKKRRQDSEKFKFSKQMRLIKSN
jgi:hypothetical protein